jgi:hypothetical protein
LAELEESPGVIDQVISGEAFAGASVLNTAGSPPSLSVVPRRIGSSIETTKSHRKGDRHGLGVECPLWASSAITRRSHLCAIRGVN